jgi:hypothetical protein
MPRFIMVASGWRWGSDRCTSGGASSNASHQELSWKLGSIDGMHSWWGLDLSEGHLVVVLWETIHKCLSILGVRCYPNFFLVFSPFVHERKPCIIFLASQENLSNVLVRKLAAHLIWWKMLIYVHGYFVTLTRGLNLRAMMAY